jgi:predicted dehydrogenase
LDAWRNPTTDVRITVEHRCCQQPVAQFVEIPFDPRMVWNYAKRIGPVAVWRKIRSRLAERTRNRKVASIGIGRVLEAPEDCGVKAGDQVAFFAPNHSPDWPRLCLDRRLIRPVAHVRDATTRPDATRFPESLQALAGWSPYSGAVLDTEVVQQALHPLSAAGTRPMTAENGHPRERVPADVPESGGQTAVLFGLGNYAKTQIIPCVRRHLHLTTIHELDPDQIATAAGLGANLDTSPWPRDGDRYDAWFIAGFHHTHAPLAIRALKEGAYAVVEKPLVATRDQFADLARTLGEAEAVKLFTCFHRRYARLNEWARADLQVRPGDPVDMHCIVYEIPLPALHWYNWPNSGSRIISNGCHWLDYFLYMNDFCPVSGHEIQSLRGRDLVASVRLDNGAQLVMSLTDTGSQRLGVRDVIDLRATNVTVRLIDSTYYEAESTTRVVRRRRVNPLESFGRMYGSICKRIAARAEGDSMDALRSTTLMLDLEDQLRDQA